MTPEARAARERKQKIFVAVGGLLLVGLLAIQLPKILGGASSPEAAPVTTTDASGLPVQVSPPGAAAPVALVASAPESAKLSSFSSFAVKDPFVQQVAMQPPVAAAAEGAGTTATKKDGETVKAPAQEFATGTTSVAAVTIVTVNGARHVLEAGVKFPASDPVFVLVAEKPDAKAVVVGIAGGVYAGGAKTTTLRVGKPLTLVNTATGAKYRISLVSVGSGDAAETPVTP